MQAMYAVKEKGSYRCFLCPHNCFLKEGQTGICGVRKADKEHLISQNYSQISTTQVDPIEKKPLYYFMPGSFTYSIGSFGCNLRCPYCQNYEIAKGYPPTKTMTPEEVVREALKLGTPSISFTYNEPIVFYEFMLDTAILAKQHGLATIMVTNGFISQEPLQQLLPYIDAMNIDLKTFNDTTYRKVCGGALKPVMETIQASVKQCHVEITTLLVTNMHTPDELENMFRWIVSLSPEIPLHVTRYFPSYQYHEPATDIDYVKKMYALASGYLKHVHFGNM